MKDSLGVNFVLRTWKKKRELKKNQRPGSQIFIYQLREIKKKKGEEYKGGLRTTDGDNQSG